MKTIPLTVTNVWLCLVAATGITWLLGHNPENHTGHFTCYLSVGLLLAAVIKITLVMEYFMELRFAPSPLRALALTWVCGTVGMLIWIYSK